jgi:hypothetical protein
MWPAHDPAGHQVPRTNPACLLHTWRPHLRRHFALVLHLHKHQSSRNLHLQYLAKNQSTQCCQSLITPGSDHPLVLEPHMVLNYSSHENTWDARNTKAYTAKESCHKYRAEYAGFFPGRNVKYLVGTRVFFGPNKNAKGRSLYLYDFKNRRVGIVMGEAAVRFCDLRLETHLAFLKCGPLPDIRLPPILYATRIPPNLMLALLTSLLDLQWC